MLSLMSYLSHVAPPSSLSLHGGGTVEIPGVLAIPASSIPPLLLVPDSTFGKILMEDSTKYTKLDGFLINTFEGLEAETLEALNGGKVVKELPPVYAIGPFVPCEFEKEHQRGATLKWLDDQPDGSVVYVSFGSRTVMGRDQMREVGDGLVRSGCRFLWVVKDKKVDREEEEEEEEEKEGVLDYDILGLELVERIKEKKGLVVKEWVDQREILSHKAVRGFVSHCGWNSVMEAAWCGVPILGWPHHSDQKLNAQVVVKRGWGVWEKDWGWAGERVVKGEEIGEAIKEMMNDESLLIKALQVKEDARKTISSDVSVGEGCEASLNRLTQGWNKISF